MLIFGYFRPMITMQIPTFYFGHLKAVLAEHHIDITPLVHKAGLDMSLLASPDALLPVSAFSELVHPVLEQDKLDHLGLEIGARLNIAHHGAFGLALLNAPDLRRLIRCVIDFIVTRIPFIELTMRETETSYQVFAHDLQSDKHVHRFVMEAVSMAFINLQHAMNARGNTIRINRIRFDYPQGTHLDRYQHAFDAELAFNAAFCGFDVDKGIADEPLQGSDEMSFTQALSLCEHEKHKLLAAASVSGRVRQYFHSHKGTLPDLSATAKHLAMSERSLNRALKHENTGFSKLSDQWLSRHAVEMLVAHGIPVEQTALALGYAETSNFRRAFKRWFRCSPSQYKHVNALHDRDSE